MKTADVTIAGKTYKVAELPARRNAAWRAELAATFAPLATAVERFPQMLETELTKDQLPGLIDLVRSAGGSLLAAPDELARLLYLYAPAIAKDKDLLEEAAFDSEYLAAFTAVLALAYPFGSYIQVLTSVVGNGSTLQQTGQNLPGRNGESGTTK